MTYKLIIVNDNAQARDWYLRDQILQLLNHYLQITAEDDIDNICIHVTELQNNSFAMYEQIRSHKRHDGKYILKGTIVSQKDVEEYVSNNMHTYEIQIDKYDVSQIHVPKLVDMQEVK